MTTDKKVLKVFTLSPEETEKLLEAKFGEKLAPVNKTRLAQQRQKRERYLLKTEEAAKNIDG